MSMLSMFHANPATLEEGVFQTDRKFLAGMERYAQRLSVPLATIHRKLLPGERIMDPVSVPVASLPYRVEVLDTDFAWQPLPHDQARLDTLVASSTLVCHGFFNVGPLCAAHGVPEIVVAEHDRATAVTVATAEASRALVKLVRGMRAWRQHGARTPSVRRAMSVHCNGYPVYEELLRVNPRCLLYLDSRMGEKDVIDAHALEQRLAQRRPGRLRLLYSGRYEALKGALDVVKTGLACLSRGLDIEMHLYGQGSLAEPMRRLAAGSAGRITVHDAVPFTELVALSRGFDAFVSCHVQSDPSCTYLESFGCGLPIVGYDNRMWRGLQRVSGVGVAVPMHDVDALAGALQRYVDEPSLLARHAQAARAFALAHGFEHEFAKRIGDLSHCFDLASRQRTSFAWPRQALA